MSTFVIIFRQVSPLTDADRQQRAAQTADWARRLQAQGHELVPHMLAPEGPQLGTPLPGLAAIPAVTALLFITAHDLEEAARIAQSHPALQYGAHAEVHAWTTPVRS